MKFLTENWTFGIFLLAFLSLLFVGFSAMLDAKVDPIKKDIARIEVDTKARFDRIEVDTKARFDRIERDTKVRFDRIEVDTKARFDRIERDTKVRFDRIENNMEAISEKLNRLLMRTK